MSRSATMSIVLQGVGWLSAAALAGAVVGLAVAILRGGPIDDPLVFISVLCGVIVGVTVFLSSVVMYPTLRAFGPLSRAALLACALVAGAVAGTAIVGWSHPFFVLRAPEQTLVVVALNAALALVVGAVAFMYEEMRARLSESLRVVEEVRLVEARLQEQAARAELAALQARINPHFFFNTLNTISSLVDEDPERADDVLQTLADLFRYTLKVSDAAPVPLPEELEFIRAYLGIEQARFGERLRVRWDVDPASKIATVPGLALQPLVENAVTHGIAPLSRGGTIRIATRIDADGLCLEVEDDGQGLPAEGARNLRPRHGLDNVLGRLRTIYGEGVGLELLPGATGRGTLARLTLPLTTDAPPRSGSRDRRMR